MPTCLYGRKPAAVIQAPTRALVGKRHHTAPDCIGRSRGTKGSSHILLRRRNRRVGMCRARTDAGANHGSNRSNYQARRQDHARK